MIIPLEQYKQALDTLPILCVDLLLQNKEGEYLLVYRNNEPLKGEWWVPGGRIHKTESVMVSARRKCQEELGLGISSFEVVGFLEEFFEDAPFGVQSGFHAVSIVLHAVIDTNKIKLDQQSENWKFSKELPPRIKIQPFQKGSFL